MLMQLFLVYIGSQLKRFQQPLRRQESATLSLIGIFGFKYMFFFHKQTSKFDQTLGLRKFLFFSSIVFVIG